VFLEFSVCKKRHVLASVKSIFIISLLFFNRIGSLFYVNYIFVRFCIPVFQDFNKNHVTLESFARSILNCHLSGSLLLLIGFFAFLHCWLNAFSEMLCFGDRMFYQDWWNSTNFQTYYRTVILPELEKFYQFFKHIFIHI
jgi:hypothetical protein